MPAMFRRWIALLLPTAFWLPVLVGGIKPPLHRHVAAGLSRHVAAGLSRQGTSDPQAVLAQTSGRIAVAGLREPVEVFRDPWGVPHIYAKNTEDLFFAQGFVAAQDRLWQMEMWRRAGEGRLAEILGEKALERDIFARLVRYRGDMEAEWKSYAPDAREIIEAFVRGVNASMEQSRDRLPIEFQMMGVRPEPWTPEVCLLRMAGYVMSGNVASEVLRAQMVARLGSQRAAELMPPDPQTSLEPPPGLDLALIDNRILAGHRAASATPNFREEARSAAEQGSNNWTVAGKRTVTGKPILANDPHRTIALPSLRYITHLVAPGWNIIGAGEPALPGVAAGHNERVAFGFTIFAADQQDLYVEATDPADPKRYRYRDGWETMRAVKEQIRVKGRAQPVEVELLYTRHGPVIHQDRARNVAHALRWAGLEPGGAGYLASLSLNRARNWQEFLAALERWKLPPENLVYADVDGNIGYQAAGLAPRRRGWNGLLPVPGSSGRYEWDGFLPLRELPRVFNPPEGFIATANHRTIPSDYPQAVGYEWAPPYRYERIVEVLRSKERFSLEDFERLQHDEVSLPARELVAMLPAAVAAKGASLDVLPAAVAAKGASLDVLPASPPEMLRHWDGNLSRDSAAAALYEVMLQKLSPKILLPLVPQELRSAYGGRASLPVVMNLLRRKPEAARQALFEEAIREAEGEARGRRWGDLHKAFFEHPLSRQFNLPEAPRGGDGTTPNATSPNASFRQTSGASYREILDVEDWDRSQAINVPGQSGQPGSPHYGDLLPLWAEGKYFPLLFSRTAVEKTAKDKLLLVPAKQ